MFEEFLPLTFKTPNEFKMLPNKFLTEDFQNPNIDLMNLSKTDLMDFAMGIFKLHPSEDIDFEILDKFVQVIAHNYYDNNSFHNFSHAVSVLQFAYILLSKASTAQFSPLESITLLVCALCHDVGHPGISNKFLNSICSKLSLIYGFQSTLERMHIAITLSILSDPKYDFLKLVSDKKLELYQKITDIILVTDLANAFKLSEEIRHIPLSNITVV
eukprot:NODE_59_length_28102_cov_0.971110.p15 type:complete len:215 gc:universal NODE_59_length_28102_cov_0.971110:7322-7966(+)